MISILFARDSVERQEGMRRILVSPCLSPRRLPLSISRRACLLSISAPSNFYLKPRRSAPNSSWAVNSGLNDILSNGTVNTSPNDSPNKNSSQNGKHLL